MGPDRVKTVDSLYHAALALPPESRQQFLDITCEGDDILRKTVECRLVNDTSPYQNILFARPQPRRGWFRPSQIIGGRFEVIELLGSGGMGDVYEVKDLQLFEHVALKTIRPDLAADTRIVARFKREILIAKRVTHPNVCRIYDVGFHTVEGAPGASVLFLTMELLRGESLASRLRRGRLPVTEALEIVEQMATGLAAAHASGVVHRDFKCANVMLVPANTGFRAVITDFGLAQSVQESAGSDLKAGLTAEGKVAGTPDYMAPEQVLGKDLTFAADIYALGVVMYEMVTGELPFQADNPTATACKRLLEPAVPPSRHVPDLDPRWERVILRCLERDPRDRFESPTQVVRALTGLEAASPFRGLFLRRRRLVLAGGVASIAAMGGTAILWRRFYASPPSSLAVLPITSSDSDLDYVTEGMTEDLINMFGQRQGLRVMSRAAVYGLKDNKLSAQDLGRRLNVRYLLTGRLLKKTSTVSITVELTDARDGVHVWGAQYERPVATLVDVQQEMARSVLAKLDLPLETKAEKRLGERSASPEVNELYWRARYFWNKRTQDGFQKAMRYFGEAIEKDPSFARAYAGLADCYAMRSGAVPPRQTFPSAKSAATRAIQLDDSLAEGHASLAFILLFYDWDWPRAEAEYLRAMECNPNYPTAHSMYGMYLVAMKRFPEAMQHMKRALELDPSSLAIHTGVGRVLLYARRYQDAAAQYSSTLEMDPTFPQALFDLGITRAMQGRYDEATALLERGLRSGGEDGSALAQIAYVHRLAGRSQDAASALERLERLSLKRYVSPYFLAIAHIGEADDRTLTLLEEAYEDRSYSMIYLNVDPRLDRLRSTPRYHALQARLRFSAA